MIPRKIVGNGIILGALLIALLFVDLNVAAETIIVDDDGGADYDNVEDAVVNSSSGDKIIIKAGSYGKIFNVPNNLTIEGQDKGSVFIKDVNLNSDNIEFSNINAYALSINDAHNITIKNSEINTSISGSIINSLYLENVNFLGGHRDYGIYFQSVENIIIENNDLSYSPATTIDKIGINIYNGNNISIINNKLFGLSTGINIEYSTRIFIDKNEFNDLTTGIFFNTQSDTKITNNNFYDINTALSYLTKPLTISNNHYTNVETINYDRDNRLQDESPSLSLMITLFTITIYALLKRR